jgi:hypothetical protein
MALTKFEKRDLQHAAALAKAEKYHLLTFSDGAFSSDHIIRVIELENAERALTLQLEAPII